MRSADEYALPVYMPWLIGFALHSSRPGQPWMSMTNYNGLLGTPFPSRLRQLWRAFKTWKFCLPSVHRDMDLSMFPVAGHVVRLALLMNQPIRGRSDAIPALPALGHSRVGIMIGESSWNAPDR
jgi:hypothetical protein